MTKPKRSAKRWSIGSMARMPSVGTRSRVHARAEGQHGQDHELVRGVVAVDVEPGVGLGVALLLGLADRGVEGEAVPRMRVST